MLDYEPVGSKEDDYAYYTTLNFLEKNIEHFYPEDIEAYSSSVLGRLFKWVTAMAKIRKQDIIRRKALQKKAKDAREEATQKETKRKERLNSELADAEAKFNEDHKDEIEAAMAHQLLVAANAEDKPAEECVATEPVPQMPVFNKQDFLAKWLTENPVIEIPEAVADDVDNDWLVSPAEAEYHINVYFGKE